MAKERLREGVTDSDKKAFEKFLAEDEELVFATGYGKTYLRQKFLLYIFFPNGIFILLGVGLAYFLKANIGIGMLLGLVAACFGAYLKAVHLYHSNRYLLTTRRVIIKRGILAVKVISSLYDKITHIEVEQGIMDRLVMHHGNIIINTAGSSSDAIKFLFIDEPLQVKNLLERLINKQREYRGRPTGPVITVEGEIVD